jgi:hypothetical protein
MSRFTAEFRNGFERRIKLAKLLSLRHPSDGTNAAFVRPDLDPDVRRSAERVVNGFQHVTCADLFGPFQ